MGILIEDTGIAVASSLMRLVRVDFMDREGKVGRAQTKRVASVVWTWTFESRRVVCARLSKRALRIEKSQLPAWFGLVPWLLTAKSDALGGGGHYIEVGEAFWITPSL